ncbi:MAG: VWA domain-containing protein [Myxococcales bacterium]|nr:VWA domain-containing protein [Myxococcales bacterium]
MIVGALLFAACQTAEFPAPIVGTAYRITEDRPMQGSEVRIDVMANERECLDGLVDDLQACLPAADRASGELKVSFRLRDPESGLELPRALRSEQVEVVHGNAPQEDVQLVPHEAMASGQLFILLIDGSTSMHANGQERIRKVRSALLRPSVVEGFFPDENTKTGVVLLRFSRKVTGIDGGPPKILTTRTGYERAVRTHLLKRSGGYTHLYDAVEYAVTDLLDAQAIRTFLTVKGAEPTVVVLTDGFNNEGALDTCASNVPRLQKTVDLIRDVRTSQGGATRPTIYTVGLGVPYRKEGKPSGLNRPVTPRGLCGGYGDYLIDPSLEEAGIDHVSMQWIAEAGAGSAFVKRKPRGLAEVFEAASATRYRWYEIWYRAPDNFYHRRSFPVKLQLRFRERAQTEFDVLPSGWIDGPRGQRGELGQRWHEKAPFRSTFVVLIPALGLVLLLQFWSPAMFNARRALFRGARRRSKRDQR